MDRLEKTEEKILKIKKEFGTQISAISEDNKDFHKHLINISSKNPEYSELIDFIVFVNDKSELNQHLFKEIVSNTINDLTDVKKDILLIIKEERLKKTSKINFNFPIKDIKWILIAASLIVLIIGFIINPTGTIALLKMLPFIK